MRVVEGRYKVGYSLGRYPLAPRPGLAKKVVRDRLLSRHQRRICDTLRWLLLSSPSPTRCCSALVQFQQSTLSLRRLRGKMQCIGIETWPAARFGDHQRSTINVRERFAVDLP